MLRARYIYHPLVFRKPAGTSRGYLNKRQTWFLVIHETNQPDILGIGECGLIPGLSPENMEQLQNELDDLCHNINNHKQWLSQRCHLFPSLGFALETAISDLNHKGGRIFGETSFTRGETGIPINGLIWMGDADNMKQQLQQKLLDGFRCIKIKIGAIDIEEELALIAFIRKEFNPSQIEIRVDANGAFSAEQAKPVMERLAQYQVHSIEQPIAAGQWKQMADLCRNAPIPVALDEELIGVYDSNQQKEMLEVIRPQYIILKPSLLGGLKAAQQWVSMAASHGIGWWTTSALESNIGLNAIAQWTFKSQKGVIQGLGTGQLYTNNIAGPLEVRQGFLFHNAGKPWQLDVLSHEI